MATAAAQASSSTKDDEDRLAQTDGNMLVTSTITRPNMQKLIRAISYILLDQIEEDASLVHKMKQDEDWSVSQSVSEGVSQ